MSALRKVSLEAAAMKPPHGKPCNRCGVCCEATLCPLAQRVIGPTPGPCPALTGAPGSRSCGIVATPELYAPVLAAKHGRDQMARAAALIIGAGQGCDARINGEPPDNAFYATLEARDITNARAIQQAQYLWCYCP